MAEQPDLRMVRDNAVVMVEMIAEQIAHLRDVLDHDDGAEFLDPAHRAEIEGLLVELGGDYDVWWPIANGIDPRQPGDD